MAATSQQQKKTRDQIFDFIVQYKQTHDGNSPTTREIADACYLSSLTTVRHHLMNLELENRLRIADEGHYQFEIVGSHWEYETSEQTASDSAPQDHAGEAKTDHSPDERNAGVDRSR